MYMYVVLIYEINMFKLLTNQNLDLVNDLQYISCVQKDIGHSAHVLSRFN